MNGGGAATVDSLLQPDFSPGHTLQYLDRFSLQPEEIVIEVTEQHPIDDFAVIRRAVAHYRHYGFAVAIDDLGAGNAGLRLWEELRPDYVKIDRHFIQGIDEDPVKLHLVRSMQQLARTLDCRLVADGVESPGELLAVSSLGIEFVQGYYFARPQASPPQNDSPTVGTLITSREAILPAMRITEVADRQPLTVAQVLAA